MSRQSIEEYNRNHALTHLNHNIGVLVWALGVGALASSFVPPLALPWLGTLPTSLGTNYAINNFIIQAGLLMLFVNTKNVFEYYVCKLEYPFACRIMGSLVYLAHLFAVVISFRKPALWLWCVGGILALRAITNLQLYLAVRGNKRPHPWLEMLGGWLKRSVVDTVIVFVYAALVQVFSDVRFYAWAHGLGTDVIFASAIAQLLLRDIRTLLNLVAVYQIGTHAFQQVRMRASFPKQEIEENYKLLTEYYQESDVSNSA